jgi:hypothetical protein
MTRAQHPPPPQALPPAALPASMAAAAMVEDLSVAQLDAQLEKMMDTLYVSELRRMPLRTQPPALKRQMLASFMTMPLPDPAARMLADVARAPPEKLGPLLESLRAALTSLSIQWVLEFRDARGLDVLARALDTCNERPDLHDAQHKAVMCLKAFMNNRHGLQAVLAHRTVMRVLARALASPNERTLVDVLKLMAAVCLVPPDGHRLALEAMTSLTLARTGGGFRFTPLVRLLGVRDATPSCRPAGTYHLHPFFSGLRQHFSAHCGHAVCQRSRDVPRRAGFSVGLMRFTLPSCILYCCV